MLEKSAPFCWEEDTCCGSYILINQNNCVLSISGDEALENVANMEYYLPLLPDKMSDSEFSDLSEIITKKQQLPFQIKNQTLEITIKDTGDYPFELLKDESSEIILSTNLVVRNIPDHIKHRQLKRIIKTKGFIKTENPVPELIFSKFEDTSYNISMKHIGSNFIFYETERVKNDVKFLIENSDILHICGHSIVDKKSISFQINGKESVYLTEKDINECETVPEFIWMNSCHSSCWAKLFLKKGCHIFIGSTSILKDDFAEMISEVFYKHLSSGEYAGYAYYRMIQKFKNYPEILKIRFFGDKLYKIC